MDELENLIRYRLCVLESRILMPFSKKHTKCRLSEINFLDSLLDKIKEFKGEENNIAQM